MQISCKNADGARSILISGMGGLVTSLEFGITGSTEITLLDADFLHLNAPALERIQRGSLKFKETDIAIVGPDVVFIDTSSIGKAFIGIVRFLQGLTPQSGDGPGVGD